MTYFCGYGSDDSFFITNSEVKIEKLSEVKIEKLSEVKIEKLSEEKIEKLSEEKIEKLFIFQKNCLPILLRGNGDAHCLAVSAALSK